MVIKVGNRKLLAKTLKCRRSREFRIIHALSHHLYTNTIIDIEISGVEPFIEYLPKKKTGVVKYLSWVYVFFIWVTFLHQTVIKK